MKHKLTDLSGTIRYYDSGLKPGSLVDALTKYEVEKGAMTSQAFDSYLRANGFETISGGFAWDELTLTF